MPPQLQDAWMTAPMPGPNGPGVSSAGGASLVIFSHSQTQAGGVGADGVPVALGRAAALLRAHRQHAAAALDLAVLDAGRVAVCARHFSTQLDRVRSPPKVPEWERIAQEMRLAAERVVQGVASVDRGVRRARSQDRRDPREAALDDGQGSPVT